jgi:hypothetical protein
MVFIARPRVDAGAQLPLPLVYISQIRPGGQWNLGAKSELWRETGDNNQSLFVSIKTICVFKKTRTGQGKWQIKACVCKPLILRQTQFFHIAGN